MKSLYGLGHFPSRRASAAGLAALLVLLLTVSIRADQRIWISTPAPDTTVVRIDQPIVTQAVTQYPQIVFHPRDTVTVDAGGCVQTGGFGKTWKRYVNPSGRDSPNRSGTLNASARAITANSVSWV